MGDDDLRAARASDATNATNESALAPPDAAVVDAIVSAFAAGGDSSLRAGAEVFAVRWPGLRDAPDDAPVAFARAVSAWGRSYTEAAASVGPRVCALDPEVDLVAASTKPACLKETVPSAEAPRLARAYRAMGLHAAVVDHHGLDAKGHHDRGGGEFALVAVASSDERLARVVEAQRAHAAGRGPGPIDVMGDAMGYPACCVAAFAAQDTRRDNADNERLTFRRAPEGALHPLVHRLGRHRLIGHHLCSPACAASIPIAEAVLDRVAALDPHVADRIFTHLARPVLFLDINRRIELEGHWTGDAFIVTSFTPLDGADLSLDPKAIARIHLTSSRVTFLEHDGRAITLDVDRPLLSTPGSPLAPPALDAIGGPLPAPLPAPIPPSPRPALPNLPAAVRPGVRVSGYHVTAVRRHDDAITIELAAGAHRFTVRLRAHTPDRPFTLRRGRWAIDVDDPAALPPDARAALAVLARALPA